MVASIAARSPAKCRSLGVIEVRTAYMPSHSTATAAATRLRIAMTAPPRALAEWTSASRDACTHGGADVAQLLRALPSMCTVCPDA